MPPAGTRAQDSPGRWDVHFLESCARPAGHVDSQAAQGRALEAFGFLSPTPRCAVPAERCVRAPRPQPAVLWETPTSCLLGPRWMGQGPASPSVLSLHVRTWGVKPAHVERGSSSSVLAGLQLRSRPHPCGTAPCSCRPAVLTSSQTLGCGRWLRGRKSGGRGSCPAGAGKDAHCSRWAGWTTVRQSVGGLLPPPVAPPLPL